jgi:ADP-L-glycero-D-manno-heptose 6-epimerase
MRIVVTGGAGFIGSCLIWKLNSNSVTDIIVVDQLDDSEKWKNLVGKSIEDYMEKDKFLDHLEGGKLKGALDMIVHFGACTSTTETDAAYLMENNYLYSKRLAKWAIARRVPFLYASSAATYGNGEFGYSDQDENSLRLKPLNLYGYSKQLFDLWVIKHGLSDKLTGFKFFNVYGPNEYHKAEMKSVIAKRFETVLKQKTMQLFKSYRKEFADGEQKRDFIYVKDAIDIVWYFIEHAGKKGIFNVGTGNARSWNDVANALFSALDIKPDIDYIEMPQELQEKYQYFTQADPAKLNNAGCVHRFLSLEEAVKDFAGYLKNHSYL